MREKQALIAARQGTTTTTQPAKPEPAPTPTPTPTPTKQPPPNPYYTKDQYGTVNVERQPMPAPTPTQPLPTGPGGAPGTSGGFTVQSTGGVPQQAQRSGAQTSASTPLVNSGRDYLRNFAIVEAAYRSAAEGRFVTV